MNRIHLKALAVVIGKLPVAAIASTSLLRVCAFGKQATGDRLLLRQLQPVFPHKPVS